VTSVLGDKNGTPGSARGAGASLPGIEIVAEAANGREALALIEQLRPHIAVLDITMP